MSKLTVILNDYGTNMKMYITYDAKDRARLDETWKVPNARLIALGEMDAFKGRETWEDLTVSHYRFLITQCLSALARLKLEDRTNVNDENVMTTRFLILAFVKKLEDLTDSEIEHFRINRFDTHSVTFNFSAAYELDYDEPKGKLTELAPSLSIVVDNLDDRKD